MEETGNYIKTLKERAKQSKVYKNYQLVGLEISQLLNDEKHKSLYIKLAKTYDTQYLLSTAKDVSQRKNIENKGGYFMRIIQREKLKNKNDSQKPKNSNHK